MGHLASGRLPRETWIIDEERWNLDSLFDQRELVKAGTIRAGLTFHGLRKSLSKKAADLGFSENDISAAVSLVNPASARPYTIEAARDRGACSRRWGERGSRAEGKKSLIRGLQAFPLCALHATIGYVGVVFTPYLDLYRANAAHWNVDEEKGAIAVAPFVPALPEGSRRRCSDEADEDNVSSSTQSQACLKRSLVLSQGSLVMSAFNSNRGLINALAGLGGPVADYRVTHIRMATTSPYGLFVPSFEHIELMLLSTGEVKTRQQVVDDIVNRRATYHTDEWPLAPRAYLEVETRGLGPWYARTKPDCTTRNNLLSLPRF